MEEIIKPVSKELLKAELTEDKRLRMTNKSKSWKQKRSGLLRII